MPKKPDPNTPIVISGKSIAMLSLMVTQTKEGYKDEAGKLYKEAPKFLYVMDAQFKLQEEEEATPGLPDWWWHYHRTK
jgi:hypothetical protein